MTLGQPAYLSSLQGNIRARPIPWDGARRAGDLTEEQSALIDLVKTPSPDRKQRVEADIDGFRDLFAGGHGKPSVLETARQNTKVLQYMLVLLADLVTGNNPTYYLLAFPFQGSRL
jgi:V-type H+-transporting ATPase subunit H